MVLPTLPPELILTPEKRRNILRRFIPRMIEEGWSANRGYREIKGTPLGIRRTDFLGMFRESLGVFQRERRIRYVPRGRVPSPAVLEDAPFTLTDNYRIVYNISFLDRETGTITEQYFGMDIPTLSSIEEMEFEGQSIFGETYKDKVERVMVVKVHTGYINPELR